jgi:hypothetical protein
MKYTRIYTDRNRCTGARGRLNISVQAGQSAIANDPESVVYLEAALAFRSDRGLGRGLSVALAREVVRGRLDARPHRGIR